MILLQAEHLWDEASASSTFTAEPLVAKELPSSLPANCNRKILRFDMKHNQEFDSCLYLDELGCLWYAPDDYVEFRAVANQQTRLVLASNPRAGSGGADDGDPRNYTHLLMEAFRKCVDSSASCEQQHDADETPTNLEACSRNLSQWFHYAPDLIGLERLIIGPAMNRRRRTSLMQLHLILRGYCSATYRHEDLERVRANAQIISAASVRFSHFMALAQANTLDKNHIEC